MYLRRIWRKIALALIAGEFKIYSMSYERDAFVSFRAFSEGNYTVRHRDFSRIRNISVHTDCTHRRAQDTQDTRARRPHPLFRVSIPRVNSSRWQPFSIAECRKPASSIWRKRYTVAAFALFTAICVAWNSGDCDRIPMRLSLDGMRAQSRVWSIIGLGSRECTEGMVCKPIVSKIFPISRLILCVTLHAVPGEAFLLSAIIRKKPRQRKGKANITLSSFLQQYFIYNTYIEKL